MTATFADAIRDLAVLWDKATYDREIVVLERQGSENVALIALDELQGLLETAHLLRSPANAKRLLAAIARTEARTERAQTPDELRAEVGLGPEA